MQWTDIMDIAELIPNTAQERAAAGADLLGVLMTTLWLSGFNHLSVDTWLHTSIAVVTLASVSFSLGLKIHTFIKKRNEQDS